VRVSPAANWWGWGARIDGASVDFTCAPDQRTAALEFCAESIQVVRLRGFSPQLFDRVRKAMIAELDETATRQASAGSMEIADYVAYSLASGDVPVGLAVLRDRLRGAWQQLDASACSAAFAEAWAPGTASANATLSIVSIGPTPPASDDEATWTDAQS